MIRFEGIVRHWDTYGRKVRDETLTVIIAADRAEAIAKMRRVFNATYNDFRKFWSHDFQIERVVEMSAHPAPDGPEQLHPEETMGGH